MLPLAGAVLLVVIVNVHGFFPGLQPDGPWTHLSEGAIRCHHDLGVAVFTSRCSEFGEPFGFPLLSNGPVVMLGALFMYLPGIDAYGAYMLSGASILGLALAGGYGLMREFDVGRWVALATSAAYLLTPSVVGLQGFGGTLLGFALLPAFAFVDLRVLRALDARQGWSLAPLLAGYAGVKTSSLFLDGYSFVVANLVSAALFAAWLARRGTPNARRAAAAAALVGANLVAFVLYKAYAPETIPTAPLDLFRAMGLDLFTLIAPTTGLWAFDAVGFTADHRDLWGDGNNSAFNYLGAGAVGLAAIGLLARRHDGRVVAIAAAGLIALVLSFGPSIKVNDHLPTVESRPTAASYLAPESATDLALPWGELFTSTPGLSEMRAVYRWSLGTRFAIIVLCGLAVAAVLRRPGGRRVAVGALAALAVIELAPNVPDLLDAHARHREHSRAFLQEVAGGLQADAGGAKRAFFLNYDGTYNAFTINNLASVADVGTYNVGGDKNVHLSSLRWPPEVQALAQPGIGPDHVDAALTSGHVDVVIAPEFHLRWAAYFWPPTAEERAAARATFAPILADQRFQVRRHTWFSTIRLKPERRTADAARTEG